jgi:hypothetical protein
MSRPTLTREVAPEVFGAYYWLKKELQEFCSAQSLPTAGSKEDLTKRVNSLLSGQPLPEIPARAPMKTAMRGKLTLETAIGSGWRLNESLRRFFIAQTGSNFRFNQTLRDVFKNPDGKTLGEAVEMYQASLGQERRPPIGRQFQFNRHMRDYFLQHPGASRAEALEAWKTQRQTAQALVFPVDSQ